jgi:SAM-dependent methyltransferase
MLGESRADLAACGQSPAAGYHDYYDLVVQTKDYRGEVSYLLDLMQHYAPAASEILDVGCGTGSHDVLLAERGYRVCGIDNNARMVEKAQLRILGMGEDVRSRLTFRVMDARQIDLDRLFDVVVALYNVIGYMTTNCDLSAMLSSASRHTKSGGMFVCDCWYGPAFLSKPPQTRIRRGEDMQVSYLHIAQPTLVASDNRVDVNYTLLVSDKASGATHEFTACSSYRYFSLPEIHQLFQLAGFDVIDAFDFRSRGRLSLETRELCVLARRR